MTTMFSGETHDPKAHITALMALLVTGVIGAVLIVAAASLTRIQPPPQAVNFETVFHGDVPLVISKEARRGSTFYSQLFLLTSITDVQTLSVNYSSHANDAMISALSEVDYSRYGVLIAYLGASLNTGSAITIEAVSRIGNTIEVRTVENRPQSGDKVVVNYFHAIVVKRSELPEREKITISHWPGGKGFGYIPH